MGFTLLAPFSAMATNVKGLSISEIRRQATNDWEDMSIRRLSEGELNKKSYIHYDTDEEDGSNEIVLVTIHDRVGKLGRTRKKYNRSRNRPRSPEKAIPYVSTNMLKRKKTFPPSLAKDARHIQEAENNCMTRESTINTPEALAENIPSQHQLEPKRGHYRSLTKEESNSIDFLAC